MIKFNQLMKAAVGKKEVSFTGREEFCVEDEAFRKDLLALGIFEKSGPDTLRYSGKITVPMKDGSEKTVDPRGFLAVEKKDLADKDAAGFL